MRTTLLCCGITSVILVSVVTFIVPEPVHAAVQCPNGWTLGVDPTGTSGLQGCYNNGNFVGYAVDPALYPPCQNGGGRMQRGFPPQIDCVTANDNPDVTDRPFGVTNGSCDGIANSFFNFSACIGKSIAVWIGTGIVHVTGFFLGLAATLFNWVASYTIGSFAILYGWVEPAIGAVWTVFRDIANIIIIGIFTFVAIEMILGTHLFGGKKMIAQVLLIAILINFSLLFTRIIIQSSNLIAVQFYRAMDLQSAGTPSSAFSTSAGSQISLQGGISGKFAQAMGLGGTLNTSAVLKEIQDNPDKGGWMALMHGFFTGLIFIGATVILLILSYLLVVRFVMMIFLAMTSSLAFATYLLPQSFVGNYGWSGWWQSLIKSAVLAPLLLMLLWATLKVGAGVTQTVLGPTNSTPVAISDPSRATLASAGSAIISDPSAAPSRDNPIATVAEAADTPATVPPKGSLGALVANPAEPGGLSALFGYLVILGMLFASAKIARSFSDGIAGFNYAKMFTSSPLAVGERAIGFLGRRFIGGGYALGADRAEKRRSVAADNAALSTGLSKRYWEGQANKFQRLKERREGIANSSFRVSTTESGKKLFDFLQAPKAVMGGAVKGELDRQKEISAAAAKFGKEAMEVSKDAAKKMREEAVKTAQTKHTAETGSLEKKKQNADTVATANGKTQKASEHERDIQQAQAERKRHEDDEAEALRRGDRHAADTARQQMRDQDAIIENAQKAITTYLKASKDLTDHVTALPKVMKEAEKSADDELGKMAGRVASRAVLKGPLGFLDSALNKGRLTTGGRISEKARKEAEKSLGAEAKADARWKKRFESSQPKK